ncbi:PREDICTED: membrane-spanning 4-domains subfamily A member 6A [Condylura cristata]|uniref:membrane-spanning 4-domains subfamily A member 6A n=1 Tax=Condylura cristata TaxID=143302 RepID=UPI0003343213|nr:PREDICTED: membrane-spanning 4-domains subfamily A member 6A [Condylura cristata]
MIAQPVANENIVILTPNGLKFLQTEKPEPTNQSKDNVEKHLKAEVKILGTIQILCGVMVLFLGIILTSASLSPHFTKVFSILLKAAYPFIGALCFIISGSLSIVAEKKSTKTLVQCCLAANILSLLSALVGLALLSVNLTDLSPTFRGCDLDANSSEHEEHPFYYHTNMFDHADCPMGHAVLTGVLSMILICTLLEFFLAVLAAVIWWKQHPSNFPGSVIFLPHSYCALSNMSQKAANDSTYEELMT